MHCCPRVHFAWLGLSLVLLAAPVAPAQVSDVTVSVQPADIGLGGVVRPGSWTPMRVRLSNRSATLREVRCRWVLTDIDGDRVQAWRSMALTPGRDEETAWLYAVPPYNLPATVDWRIHVHDEKSGKLLASQQVAVAQRIEAIASRLEQS